MAGLAWDGQRWTVPEVEGTELCVQNQPIFSISSCSKPRDGQASLPSFLFWHWFLPVSGLVALVALRPGHSIAALQSPSGLGPEVSCGCTFSPGHCSGRSKGRCLPHWRLFPPSHGRLCTLSCDHPRLLLSPMWVSHHHGAQCCGARQKCLEDAGRRPPASLSTNTFTST